MIYGGFKPLRSFTLTDHSSWIFQVSRLSSRSTPLALKLADVWTDTLQVPKLSSCRNLSLWGSNGTQLCSSLPLTWDIVTWAVSELSCFWMSEPQFLLSINIFFFFLEYLFVSLVVLGLKVQHMGFSFWVCACMLSCFNCVQFFATHGLWPVRLLCPGIFQGRILEWVAISFSRWSSRPRDRTGVSWVEGRFFTDWATRETRKSSHIYLVLIATYHSRYILPNFAVLRFLSDMKKKLKFNFQIIPK